MPDSIKLKEGIAVTPQGGVGKQGFVELMGVMMTGT